MATSPPDHRLARVGLSVIALRALAHAWEGFDVHDIAGSLPALIANVTALVHRFGPAAGVLANQQYSELRAAAGITGSFRPLVAVNPPIEQVASNVKWATGGLYGTEPDLAAAQAKLEGSVQRLIQDVGRNSTIANVERDRTAIAWAREARPDACWFCVMLATRGAVYSSAEAAGLTKPPGGQTPTGLDSQGEEFVNRYHDHCHCVVVPVFNEYEPTAQARAWTELWNKSTGDVTGMQAKQDAFKAALAESRANAARAAADAAK